MALGGKESDADAWLMEENGEPNIAEDDGS
jgi:hypothetical protein